MRVFPVILVSAVLGTLVGAAAAYVQVSRNLDPIAHSADKRLDTVTLPTDANTPRVQVVESTYDFGAMQVGRNRSHTFVLKNVGAAPLKLGEVTTTCSCAVGDVSKEPIPPGGTGEVTLKWTARGSGPFRQSGTVETNDPLNSQVQLTIQGQLTDAEGIEPREFIFDTVAVGEEKSVQVYVMAMLQDELTVTDPQLSDAMTRENFDVKVEQVKQTELPNPKAKAGVRIALTAKPGLPVGRFNQWLTVSTNLDDGGQLEIPISGRVVGDIRVHGVGWNEELGELMFGTVESSEGKRQTLNLVIRGAEAESVKFELASIDPPELHATVGEPRKLKANLVHVPVQIEIPVGTRPMVRTDTTQGEAGRIVLKTTHSKIKELVLPVRFTVER